MTVPAAHVSLRDAALELGVHYQTAYRWVRQGLLPAVKVAGSYEVTREAIAELCSATSEPDGGAPHATSARRLNDAPDSRARFESSLMPFTSSFGRWRAA